MTIPDGTRAHRAEGDALPPLTCAVVTVSDTRTAATDESGALIVHACEAAGHQIVDRALLGNDELRVRAHVQALLARGDLDVILLTGGTGLGTKDRTVEAIRSLLTRELPGFGELFRMLSFQEQIGPAAMLSRAVAGSVGRTFIAVMPGSKSAVELALSRLVLPEIRHAVRELRR